MRRLNDVEKKAEPSMHALLIAVILVGQQPQNAARAAPPAKAKDAVPGQQAEQVALGKTWFTSTYTCKKCGATIRQFPLALRAQDLQLLEDDCRVHVQSARSRGAQQTGKLDKVMFAWINGGESVVDVREIIKPNDPRFHNENEWSSAFVLKSEMNSNLVGRTVWIETKFLKLRERALFETKDEEVYFGETHFSRRKLQNFFATFCEEYSKIERRALRSQPRQFWETFDQTLVEKCEKYGISVKIGWVIINCPTELALRTYKPEQQAAIDRVRVLIFKSGHRPLGSEI